MNVIVTIPEDLRTYIEDRVRAGSYSSAVKYLLDLVHLDRQRKQTQEKLEILLQEGLDSDSEPVTPAYWQELRASVLSATPQET